MCTHYCYPWSFPKTLCTKYPWNINIFQGYKSQHPRPLYLPVYDVPPCRVLPVYVTEKIHTRLFLGHVFSDCYIIWLCCLSPEVSTQYAVWSKILMTPSVTWSQRQLHRPPGGEKVSNFVSSHHRRSHCWHLSVVRRCCCWHRRPSASHRWSDSTCCRGRRTSCESPLSTPHASSRCTRSPRRCGCWAHPPPRNCSQRREGGRGVSVRVTLGLLQQEVPPTVPQNKANAKH